MKRRPMGTGYRTLMRIQDVDGRVPCAPDAALVIYVFAVRSRPNPQRGGDDVTVKSLNATHDKQSSRHNRAWDIVRLQALKRTKKPEKQDCYIPMCETQNTL